MVPMEDKDLIGNLLIEIEEKFKSGCFISIEASNLQDTYSEILMQDSDNSIFDPLDVKPKF